MPELPEVEVLVRHLAPLLRGKKIHKVQIGREKVLRPTSPRRFRQKLHGATFKHVVRRGKYLLFELQAGYPAAPLLLVGHLGMTGRMYLLPAKARLPKHMAVVLNLGRENFVFEDTRYFGRLTLDDAGVQALGPEPLSSEFSAGYLARALKRSIQPVKVKLLDQTVVAGVGNIYASEALFRARISPMLPARDLHSRQVVRLWQAIRDVLADAIECGSTVPLNYSGKDKKDSLFYFGRASGTVDYYEERLQVYDRAGRACPKCGAAIQRLIQAARSTFYCPRCQSPRP